MREGRPSSSAQERKKERLHARRKETEQYEVLTEPIKARGRSESMRSNTRRERNCNSEQGGKGGKGAESISSVWRSSVTRRRNFKKGTQEQKGVKQGKIFFRKPVDWSRGASV